MGRSPTCLFKEAATGDEIEEPSHTGFDISWGTTGEGSMVAHIFNTKSIGKTKLRPDDDDGDSDECDGGGGGGDDGDNERQ